MVKTKVVPTRLAVALVLVHLAFYGTAKMRGRDALGLPQTSGFEIRVQARRQNQNRNHRSPMNTRIVADIKNDVCDIRPFIDASSAEGLSKTIPTFRKAANVPTDHSSTLAAKISMTFSPSTCEPLKSALSVADPVCTFGIASTSVPRW